MSETRYILGWQLVEDINSISLQVQANHKPHSPQQAHNDKCSWRVPLSKYHFYSE